MSCIPISSKRSATTNRRIDDALKATVDLLNLTSDALAFAPIPGLSVAANGVATLIQSIMKTRQNDQGRLALAENIDKLGSIVAATMKQIDQAQAHAADQEKAKKVRVRFKTSPELDQRILDLSKDLQDLNERADELSRNSFFLRCIRSDQNADILSDLRAGVTEATMNFSIRGQITVEMLINSIEEKLDDVAGNVQLILLNQTEQKDLNDLERLLHADAEYCSPLNATESGVSDGTRTVLLEEIKDWAKGADPSWKDQKVYLLTGVAGTGKSTIAYEIAKRLEKDKSLGASFFFVRGAQDLNSTRLVFSTIAYQLARSQPTLRPYIIDAIRSHLKRAYKQKMEFQLEELIIQPLMMAPADHPPVIIVIDAVDECTELAQELVPKMLHLLLAGIRKLPFPLRAFITARPESHIETAFQSAEFTEVVKPVKLQDIPRYIVDKDIRAYLVKNVARIRIPRANGLLEARPQAIDVLTERAEGRFLFAVTSVKFLSKSPGSALQYVDKLLEDKPISVDKTDDLYLEILRNAFSKEDFTSSNVSERIKNVLGCVALLQDHLSAKTMESLIHVSAKDIRSTLSGLGSVILLPEENDVDGEIRPVHASFPQFLIDEERCIDPEFYIDPFVRHGRLASACLNILTKPGVLSRNICRLGDPKIFKDDIADLDSRVKKYVPSHVQYAILHWATHISSASYTPELASLLKDFCSKKLLVWFEVLSMMDRLDIAVQALLNVRNWYQGAVPGEDDTQKLLSDGYRFVLGFFSPIDSCPEQIYISVLPTAPSSHLLNVYLAPNPSTTSVKLLTARDSQWGLSLRVIEGHTKRVTSAKFSPNGRWIVSGAWDETVRLWDAGTGTALHTLEGHDDTVEAVDFSPDGQRVASGSSDGTVRIWNAASGALLFILPAARGNVFSVAYSLDGTKIVSGSFNNALHIWDANRGKKLEVMEGSHGCINSVSYSPDGTQIASASSNNSIGIWNGETGDLIKKMRGHTDMAKSVAFFPGGKKLVSGGADDTVRIWDIESSSCLKVLKGHSARVFSVAVSPDGNVVASGSEDSTIRLWNVQSGAVLGVLKGHTGWVESVSFSPDGRRLVSGSNDETVRIWDVGGDVVPSVVTGHTSRVTRLVISKDGRLIATASGDKTIAIWDASTGSRLRVLEGVIEYMNALAFSPDAKLLASEGRRNELRIWEVETGKIWKSLRGNKKGIEALAFSPNGEWIASGSNMMDPKLRLWRVSDGVLLLEMDIAFEEPIDMTQRLEFSPDGTKFYAKTMSDVTFIWNCENGELMDMSEPDWELEASKWRFKEEDGWIILKETGAKLCWIAGSKRADSELAYACHGNICALGGGSGHFTILDLSNLVDAY